MASFYNRYYPYYRPFFPTSRLGPRNVASSASSEVKRSHSFDCAKSDDDSACLSDENGERCSRFNGGFSFGPLYFNNFLFGDLESPIFEVFGIKLFLDDIIIVGLLFFLYNEGVQDELLYIALILLLIG